METNSVTKKDFDGIVQRLEVISQKLSLNGKQIAWIDNNDFIKIMKISRRSAQNYRDHNLISFSIIGNRIWYKLEDVEEMLTRHYRKRLS